MDKNKLVEILKECIDIKKLSNMLIGEIVEPSLKKVVDDSSNPFDDVMFSIIFPILKQEVEKKIESLIS